MDLELKRKNQLAEEIQEKKGSLNVDKKTDRVHNLRLREDLRRSEKNSWHERLAQRRVGQRQSQNINETLENIRIAPEKEPGSLEGLHYRQEENSTSTKCFGAVSFRSGSLLRAAEPHEVESCGYRCIENHKKIPSWLRNKKVGCKTQHLSRYSEQQGWRTKKRLQGVVVKKAKQQRTQGPTRRQHTPRTATRQAKALSLHPPQQR